MRNDGDEYRTVCAVIDAAKQHRRVMEHELSATGLFRSQHQLLMHISWNLNASQKELAEHLGVSPASVAVSLKKLEKGGYIVKVMDDTDNRYNQIALTRKGREIVQTSIDIFEEIDRRTINGFTKEEMHQLRGFMARICDNLNFE